MRAAATPAFATGTLADNARKLTMHLDDLVRRFKPTELYLPMPGAHQDHIAAYECGIRAVRMSYTDNQWFVPSVLLYDIPSYTADLFVTPYHCSRFVGLSAAQLSLKMAAIRAYDSQAHGAFDPADLAKQHAQYIGARVKQFAVEQFAVVRET